MPFHNLFLEKDDNVDIVTLNRPERLNAISRELHQEMMQVCRELKDDDEIRVVIWTGAGRGFCSGVDLTASRDGPQFPGRPERLDEYGWVGRQALMVYRELNKPTIAAVNGVAVGAGMSYFLPRIVGASRAFDLVFTSRFVETGEAYRIGLLDRVTTSERLLEDAKALAAEIAFWPPVAMQMSKRVLQNSMDSRLEEQLQYETHGMVFARRAPHDVEEAAASFRERRAPTFTGE